MRKRDQFKNWKCKCLSWMQYELKKKYDNKCIIKNRWAIKKCAKPFATLLVTFTWGPSADSAPRLPHSCSSASSTGPTARGLENQALKKPFTSKSHVWTKGCGKRISCFSWTDSLKIAWTKSHKIGIRYTICQRSLVHSYKACV